MMMFFIWYGYEWLGICSRRRNDRRRDRHVAGLKIEWVRECTYVSYDEYGSMAIRSGTYVSPHRWCCIQRCSEDQMPRGHLFSSSEHRS